MWIAVRGEHFDASHYWVTQSETSLKYRTVHFSATRSQTRSKTNRLFRNWPATGGATGLEGFREERDRQAALDSHSLVLTSLALTSSSQSTRRHPAVWVKMLLVAFKCPWMGTLGISKRVCESWKSMGKQCGLGFVNFKGTAS